VSLTVETGQIIEGADSYISLADARALAANYGLVLPADDTAAEVALRNGATYVGLAEPQMCGRRVSAEQSLAYPRTGVTLNGFPVANNVIPKQLIRAQVIAAVKQRQQWRHNRYYRCGRRITPVTVWWS